MSRQRTRSSGQPEDDGGLACGPGRGQDPALMSSRETGENLLVKDRMKDERRCFPITFSPLDANGELTPPSARASRGEPRCLHPSVWIAGTHRRQDADPESVLVL